jgi:hypothetical protein
MRIERVCKNIKIYIIFLILVVNIICMQNNIIEIVQKTFEDIKIQDET